METPKDSVPGEKEQRIRKLTNLYYSRPDVQKAIFAFSSNREVVPRYFEGFGKRPDSLQYPGDVFELVKKGATSLHCSQELWQEPLSLVTGMNEKQLNELRTGWDLLLDIDSKYLEYSKILAKYALKVLGFYGVKNVGIKFSGSKGFHIIIPCKAFPKEINGVKTSEMFPVWPRIITKFISEACKEDVAKEIYCLSEDKEYGSIMKYIKKDKGSSVNLSGSNIYKTELSNKTIGDRVYTTNSSIQNNIEIGLNHLKEETGSQQDVIPDLVLVSSRHLFRMPYSLHEKTTLASVVVLPEELKNFQPHDADPLKVKIRNFMPDSKEGEATEILREALDWYKNKNPDETSSTLGVRKESDFKQVKISDFSDALLPPSIKKILEGLSDGKKRGLFILINFFRSAGMDKEEFEKRIYQWNDKNEVPLSLGYIKTQISWSYRNKVAPPPNYDKDYYKGIGIIPTDEELRYKNPVNYMTRKSLQKNFRNEENLKRTQKEQKRQEKEEKQNKHKIKDNFKNNI